MQQEINNIINSIIKIKIKAKKNKVIFFLIYPKQKTSSSICIPVCRCLHVVTVFC